MLKSFFFFLLCICSILASAPWLNEDKPNSTLTEGDIALEDAPDSNEQTSAIEDYQVYTSASSPWNRKWENNSGMSEIDVRKINYTYNCSNEGESVASLNEHAADTTTNGPNIDTTTVDQQRRHQDQTNTSQRTINQLSTIQSTIKQVQTTSSTTITETSIGSTAKMTTTTTTRPISILNKEIIKAVEEGNEAKVRTLLNEGADVNARKIEEYNSTLLHNAAKKGHVNVVSLVLDKGANIEARDTDNWTPLHYAAATGRVNVVSLLLDKGANIEVKDTSNWTSLHSAAWNGHLNVVSLLLDKGANIQSKTQGGSTPLDLAKGSNKREIVEILLQIQTTSSMTFTETSIGTTSKMTTSTTTRPISILNQEIIEAVEAGNEATVRTLLNEGADVNARKIGDYLNSTLLHIASEKSDVNVVSLLLNKGANTEARTTYNNTPLHWAAMKGDVNVVSLLLDKGANIEAKDTYNWTPLHHALLFGHVNVVSLLLDKGANIEARSTDNNTPLHWAAEGGRVNVVSLLLDKGANIEARTLDNRTPLHYAVQWGHVNVVSLLLDKRANIFAKGHFNNVDLTPLDLAKRFQKTKIVEILERKQRQLITG